nr:MAG TPA: hypothetical protein [Caudoviricetes sp.]
MPVSARPKGWSSNEAERLADGSTAGRTNKRRRAKLIPRPVAVTGRRNNRYGVRVTPTTQL